MSKPRVNLLGQRFTRLLVVRYEGNVDGVSRWLCHCNCGTLRRVRTATLRNGTTGSCGCLRDDLTRTRNRRHGMTRTPTYTVWQSMMQRCVSPTNQDFADYGGRGIIVCDRWREFQNFLNDMGVRPSPRHSIDRVDNSGNYEKANCRWATPTEQARNKRDNHWLTFDGQTRTMAEWAEIRNLPPRRISDRIKFGWTVEETLTLPRYAIPYGRLPRGQHADRIVAKRKVA